jgi:hypothetical protein
VSRRSSSLIASPSAKKRCACPSSGSVSPGFFRDRDARAFGFASGASAAARDATAGNFSFTAGGRRDRVGAVWGTSLASPRTLGGFGVRRPAAATEGGFEVRTEGGLGVSFAAATLGGFGVAPRGATDLRPAPGAPDVVATGGGVTDLDTADLGATDLVLGGFGVSDRDRRGRGFDAACAPLSSVSSMSSGESSSCGDRDSSLIGFSGGQRHSAEH